MSKNPSKALQRQGITRLATNVPNDHVVKLTEQDAFCFVTLFQKELFEVMKKREMIK